MARLQTFPVAAYGGLDLVSPTQVLAQRPGFATKLNNYEALVEGGYRRINGFTKYGDVPDVIDEQDFRGVFYYKGIVVVVGTQVLHSPNGQTWFPVNAEGVTDKPSAELANLKELPRLGEGYTGFSLALFEGDEVLIITNEESRPAMLKVEGDHYTYAESTVEEAKGLAHVVKYQDHVVVGGGLTKPGTVVVSDRFKPLDYTGTGSWSVQVQDRITGLHVFRDYLYIFCRNSIYRVVNLESAKDAAVRPVTTKIGCVDGRTIQEIGGDILFLADDGLRYLGATERLDDVSLNIVSNNIRPIVDSIDPRLGPVSSIVIPSKAQYRLFFTNKQGKRMGIIGTLGGERGFQWTTTGDLLVSSITSIVDTEERIYHVGSPTTGTMRVYQHDVGDSFDGFAIEGVWESPYFNLGDSSIRKSFHLINLYLEAEDRAEVELTFTYDHEDPTVIQPEPFSLAPVVEAARYGEVVWGSFKYGAIRYPLSDVFLEGSGKWVKMQVKGVSLTNAPYIIRGYDLQFTPSGRI